MQIHVNTNDSVKGGEALFQRVEGVLEKALDRFGDRITRVEVHLNDVNAQKEGDRDNRCMMEARLGGLEPISVTHHADTLDQAIDGAAKKLQRALDSALGRLNDR